MRQTAVGYRDIETDDVVVGCVVADEEEEEGEEPQQSQIKSNRVHWAIFNYPLA